MIKLKFSLVFILFTVFISKSFGLVGSNCTFDYQCENIPYEVCNSCTLIPGLGVDPQTEKIYFLGRCGGLLPPSGVSDNPGTVHLFSANLDGTSITPLTTLPEDTGASSPSYSIVFQFLAISPFDFFIIRDIRDAISFNIIDRQTFNESVVYTQRDSPAPSFDFDLTTGKTYSCYDFDVVVFSSILTTPVFSTPDSVVYPRSAINGSCENVKVVGDNLYILAGDNVYHGSTDGTAPLEILLTLFTSSPNRPPAMEADSSAVYFTTEFSVDRSFVDGQVGPTLLFPDHTPSPNFTTLQVVNDELYFDDGAFIRRVNTTSLSTDDLIPYPFSYGGSSGCICRNGLSGENCQTCQNGQIQWTNGIPACVAYLPNSSFPSQCNFDYQCGNVPFTVCQGNQCQCRGTFTGASCSSCSGSINWDQGLPSCNNANSPNTNSSCTVSQNLRTQWISNGDEYYLYDITIQNTGSQPITTPVFFIESIGDLDITQSWNLVNYATTVPTQTLVSLFPNTLISADSDYTASGYINRGNQTTLLLNTCNA